MEPRLEETTADTTNIDGGEQINTEDLGAQSPVEIDLLDLKVAFQEANLAIKKLKEPYSQLCTVRDALRHATETDRMGRDPDFANFINTTLGSRLMPQMAREKSGDDEYLEVCSEIQEAWIRLFQKQMSHRRFDDNFICALTWCFQPACMLHQNHFQYTNEELKQIALGKQTWRHELAVDSQVDVLLDVDKSSGWLKGTVKAVDGDRLSVEFLDSDPEHDKIVGRWSTHIAEADSKTKKDSEWRHATFIGKTDVVCDVYDGNEWLEATVFETVDKQVQYGRVIPMCFVAFRVYREKGRKLRQDERGVYEGYGQKYDEWIPLNSPCFATHLSKSQGFEEKEEDDADIDRFIQPSLGFDRVYAVPRIYSSLSKKFIYLMDMFGNSGGFDELLDVMESQELDDKNLTLTAVGYLITLVSMPSKLWHKDFVASHGARFCAAIEKRFLESDDVKLRELDQNCSYQAILATSMIRARSMRRAEAKKEMEVFNLKFTKRCLESQFLEKRIQGIKELNRIITDVTIGQDTEATAEIVSWIVKNGVFNIIWDPKKTHIQLVQRSGDILRCFLKEDLLNKMLLEMFWNLTKSDYKQEVFKIIDECGYYLDQEHIEYIFQQITQTPALKLGIEEFDVISLLGRRCKLTNFTNEVSLYFWKIISDSDVYNQEVLDCCVSKFAEVIKFWSIGLKKPFFEHLVQFLKESSAPTVPVLKLFQKIVADHKDRERLQKSSAAGNSGMNYGNVPKWVGTGEQKDPIECHAVFDSIEKEHGFAQAVLDNLSAYFAKLQGKQIDDKIPRKSLKLVNDKYSHHEELDERLKFMQLYAANSSFEFTKVQLKVVYDLLSQSPIKSDLDQFLKWCKTACENLTDKVFDLNEVGEFFSEQIAQKILDLKSMPETGFHFIQMFFVSANIDSSKIVKQKAPQKKKKNNKLNDWYDLWADQPEEEAQEEAKEETQYFQVMVDPQELSHLSIIWSIVLESEVEEVYNPAINLLVYSHLSNETLQDVEEKRSGYMSNFLAKCFELIKPEVNPSARIVNRITQVIKEVIQQSEKRGTLDVRPHQAILKGELLDRILIKYMSPETNVWGEEKVERAIVFKLYTSCTVWELKSEVARMLSLTPKYLELEIPGKILLKEKQHGMSIQELGLRNNSIITARQMSLKESIPQADLVDIETQWLVPRAEAIFTEWFEMFKNPLKGTMDNFSVARFISKTTKIHTSSSDEKVQELIQQYDIDQDGCLSLQEFLQFYYDAAELPGEKRKACFKNLKNLNIRADLVKLSDVQDKALFSSKKTMPRYALQADEAQYQALWSLLDRNDETCKGTWELIRMLATNDKRYMNVIGMGSVTDADGEVDWRTFFKGSNVYEKTYMQEIILSVLEDSEDGQDQAKRIMFVEEQKISAAYSVGTGATKEEKIESAPQGPAADEIDIDEDSEEEKRQAEATELRLNWSRNFLERGGFQFIMTEMYALDVNSENLDKKQIEFMLTLIRVFLTAAFATDTQKDIGQAVKLTRKSSSIDDGDTLDRKTSKTKSTKKDKLQELLNDNFGMEILLSTNYTRLQQKTLSMVFNILQQDEVTLEDKIIVENGMSIWVGISLYEPQLFKEFTQIKHGESTAEDFILSGLIFCKENKIRQDICQGLLALSKSIGQSMRRQVQTYIMSILGKNFLKAQDHLCSQYFELFTELIDLQAFQDGLIDELAADQAFGSISYDPEALLHQIIGKIMDSQTEGSKENGDDEDELAESEISSNKERLLVGLIVLTKKIIQTADKEISDKVIQDKDLVDAIFKEFLFKSYFKAKQEQASGNEQPMELVQRTQDKNSSKKMQSNKKSREAAFSLLIELVKKSEVSFETFLQKILVPMLEAVDKPKTWVYTPPTSSSGHRQQYVGLRNLGCICYMNSMMQQFFMIPALRYNLLCVEDGKKEEIVEYKGRLIDDNMFHQMQKLFAHLELSERHDFNPFGFCFAFKEFDGGPTNIAEQKDAQEFLNLLFDRLETALKPTSRKYLLQSIFGGKQCSQMVCTECGKVKNRHEEYLNLSLNIKDIKDVYASLQKQIEGETISDYQCDGCNRKVDLSKRTLIAETPNILIVHLQRIGFNFETFETDKVNTLCKFPTMLDLKPYSYFEVMGKENRLKTEMTEEEKVAADKKKKEEEESMTEEDLQKRREAEEETREPEKEDCFEYKLVGVNVHSGTANMGHYWSYINTNRGHDEKEGDTQWIRTDQDRWMEFNDSSVTDFSFSQLEKQCFGNENPNGFMGNSYGTSGYMLFYERRSKKAIKLLVDEDQVEEEKKNGTEVHFDEEKKENYKLVDYRQSAQGEKATPIYRQVAKDNNEYNFESDIFSQEFFNFVIEIMRAAASSGSMDAKEMGLTLGKKVGFEILARCVDSSGLTHLSQVMIEILKSSDEVCKDFMRTLLDEDDAEPIMEILFECTKSNARGSLIKIIRFLVCRLKEIEKDEILAALTDTTTETFIDIYGEQGTRQKSEPRALCLKFMANVKAYMSTRAARAWKIIDTYMDLLFSFGVQGSNDVEKEMLLGSKQTWSKDSVGYTVGMTEYFRTDMMSLLGDFILQDSSPLHMGENDYRFTMGNYNMQPDFEKAFLLICIMMGETEIQKRYPLTEDAQKIGQSKYFLQQILRSSSESFGSSRDELVDMLNMMCIDNYTNTRKLAKVFIRELLNKTTVMDIQHGLKQIHSFLLIKDSLRQIRFEWIFGFGQVISKRTPGNVKKSVDVGIQCIDVLDKEAHQYKSGIVKAGGDAFLTDLFKSQKQRVEFAILALLTLLQLCTQDDEIAEYIYSQPPPTYQFARYSDWFEPFATQQRAHLVEQSTRHTTYQDLKDKQKIEILTQILSLLPSFKEKCAKFEAKWKAQKDAAQPSDFEGHQTVSMVGSNEEVINHFPPQYIIGAPVANEQNQVVAEVENEFVTVRMTKLDVEYMYSNPTGQFNLSLPEKKVRSTVNYRHRETSYAEWKRAQVSGTATQEESTKQEDEVEDIDEEEEEDYTGLEVRQWHEHSLITDIYRIDVINNCREQVKVEVGVQLEDPNEPLNCNIPLTSYMMQIFGNGITIRPVTALITKIDPSKPMNKLKLTVGAKRIRSNSSVSGIGGGVGTYQGGGNIRTRAGGNVDPTYTTAYRDVVNQIRNGTDGNRSVGFFVSEGNIGGDSGGLGIVGTSLGTGTKADKPDQRDPNLYEEGEESPKFDNASDGEAGYMSNENNFGSDLEDDLLNK